MAKTTNHVVEFEGFRFTRGSKTRVYSHAVLERCSRAADRVQAEKNARFQFRQNLAYMQELASGIHKLAAQYPEQYSPARIAREQADAQAWLALGEDGHVVEGLARFDKDNAGMQLASDGDTYFRCLGWSSRLDLAQKLAKGPACVVVPAVIVGGAS
jgi:hypothetical protein